MGFLDRFFGSGHNIAKDAEHDRALILVNLNAYFHRLIEKDSIISKLLYQFGQRKAPVRRLKQLLNQEFTELNIINKGENHLFYDVRSLEHSKISEKVSRLEWFLAHAETEYKDIYFLLHRLYLTLRSESELIEELIMLVDLRKFRKLVNKFKSNVNVEKNTVAKLIQIKDFYNIISDLARGEYIIRRMDSGEKRLLTMMQSRMQKIFSNELTQDITYKWTIEVFEKIEDKVKQLVEKDLMDQHYGMDFEFVNSPRFVDLARESIKNLREREVSEQMVNVFVHLFREWFNHERG